MKRILFLIVLFLALGSSYLYAQSGNVYSVTGLGTNTADGLLAITSNVKSSGMAVDETGNIYICDNNYATVRIINPATGIISTLAGTNAGFAGDGGPATLAQLSRLYGVCIDATGNIYVADGGNGRIRKINALTGIITTIGGGGTSTTEGVPATDARLTPKGVCVDVMGNIYTGDYNGFSSDGRIIKIDHATGLITTIAGGGTGGDGVLATNSRLDGIPNSLQFDKAGNLYVADTIGHRVRRIDAVTHIISTVAGGGTLSTDGIPATNESFSSITGCSIDASGNLFIGDGGRRKIRRVSAITGVISTICGGGTLTSEGAPALSSQINPAWVYANLVDGNIYLGASILYGNIRKFSFAPLDGFGTTSNLDSFKVKLEHKCNGPVITVFTPNYVAGRSIKTYFGDGNTDSSALSTVFISAAYVLLNHSYNASGTYTIRHILYLGAIVVDSISYNYSYTLCRSMPFNFFNDLNANCIKEGTELFSRIPMLTQIDSNGIVVDTVSSTGGFTYNAYGVSGDIYKFKPIPVPSHMSLICPSAGYFSDTLFATTPNYPTKYFGLHCPGTTVFDLAINSVIPLTGKRDQYGYIYVRNNSCMPSDATVTLHFSPKYEYQTGGAVPAPSSTTATSISWNLTGLSPDMSSPTRLFFIIWYNSILGRLTAGDTVWDHIDVTPTSGDANPANNYNIILDTVKASSDPNEIWVSPNTCITSGTLPTTLTYTINFENTGTDTAHNIYVLDTLPYNVDPKSLRLVNASNTMFIDIRKYGSYNVVKFDFPGINLLDSSHHGYCDGSVIFTVNTLPSLATATYINNRAGIYFDDNDVVMTNSVTNTIGCPRNVEVPQVGAKANISIYPNPTSGILTIKTPIDDFTTLTVTNSIGQLLLTEAITNTQTTINVNALAPGLYYLTLKGDSGVEVRKFAKE